jgi:beta-galactosidase
MIRLDDGWRFAVNREAPTTTPAFIFSNAHTDGYDDSRWRLVDLPHDWSIEDIQPGNDAFSGPFYAGAVGKQSQGFTVGGTGWYRRRFGLPESYRGKRLILCFGGVYRHADVWINGQHLGTHPYGYTEFSHDLTPYLRYGEEPNLIAVEVKNCGKNSRWYSGSGIYRHVWLMAVNSVHIAENGTFVTVAELSDGQAAVVVENELTNSGDDTQDIVATVTIRNGVGEVAACQSVQTRIQGGQRYCLRQRLSVAAPALWSPDSPSLYTAVTEIRCGGETIDRTETVFGIRTIQVDAEHGLRLNGESLTMKGGCVHHDNGPLGAAAFDVAEHRRVRLLKAAGFNAIRCAHNPPSSAFLDACDQLGMLVIDEAFDHWNRPKNPQDYHRFFAQWGERDMASMVRRDRNHPSVVLWSIGNEIPEQETVLGSQTAQMLVDCIRRHDPTRPTTIGLHPKGQKDINGLFNVPWERHDGVLAIVDVGGYNYRPEQYEQDHVRNPNRVICATETFPKDAHRFWARAERLPYVIGDFVWTSFDYLGEASIGWFGFHDKFPWTVAYCGDIDICGSRRPQSWYRGILWNDGEDLAVFVRHPGTSFGGPRASRWDFDDVSPSWTWEGCEGEEMAVVVYSCCDEVELRLNGQSLGRKAFSVDSAYTQEWSVPYAPGTLEAVGMVGGKQASVKRLVTVGPPARVRLTPERTRLASGGQDLAFVAIDFVDAAGRPHPLAENVIMATVGGPATLAGMGSARPDSAESFQQPQRHAFRGKALVILRTTKGTGEVTLTVLSPGLEPAETKLTVD